VLPITHQVMDLTHMPDCLFDREDEDEQSRMGAIINAAEHDNVTSVEAEDAAIVRMTEAQVPFDAIANAHAALHAMVRVDVFDVLRWDVAFDYSNTDNGDLASVFDGEAEEWNRTAAQVQAWR